MGKKLFIPVIIGIILLVILLVFLLIKDFVFSFQPKGHFNNDTLIVDNSYNNSYISEGNLAINDDTLYFNYNGEDSILNYGTYKINKVNSNRIYWDGPSFSPGNGLYSLQTFKNNILLKDYIDENMVIEGENYSSRFNGKIYRFNKEKDSIELYSQLDGSKKNIYLDYEVINNKIYVFSKNNIYQSNDGKKVELIFDGLSDVAGNGTIQKKCYYISNNKICYISKDGRIKEFDFKTKKFIFEKKINKKIIPFDESNMHLFTIAKCNEKIILINELASNDKTVVYNVTENFKKIYDEDISDYGVVYSNIYKNYIFLSSEECGLVLIDVNTEKNRKLLNRGVNDVYILDNNWIYYVDKIGGLNRITYDGKTTEKVFG